IGPSGSEGGAKISFAPTPIVRKRSPSRRDGVIMFSRLSLQRSCWYVLSSVMESKAAPTQSSCPSGTDRFFLRLSWHFGPGRLRRLRRARQPGVCATIFFGRDVGFAESGYSHESLRDNKSPGDYNLC